MLADDYSDWFGSSDPTPTQLYNSTQPTTNSSSTGSFNTGAPAFDWGTNITRWLQLAPNIIASAKGNTYGSTQYGQGSQGGQFGVQIPGASGSLNISPVMMIGIGIALIFVLKGRR